MERLFVYGTLGPGRPNEHVLGDIGGEWEAAWVPGTLHESGWGAELGFPGIRLDSTGQRVEGFLFSSAALVDHWGMLDAFEGEAYSRVSTQVGRPGKPAIDAWVYTLKQAPAD